MRDVEKADKKWLKEAQEQAVKPYLAWHKTGKVPGTPAFDKLPDGVQKAYFALKAAAEEMYDPASPLFTPSDITAYIQYAETKLLEDKSGATTGPEFGGIKHAAHTAKVQLLAGRSEDFIKAHDNIATMDITDRGFASRCDLARDKKVQERAAERFIQSVVEAYRQVFDDPTAGAPLAPSGEKVDPVVPKVRKIANTDLEKAAVEQVQRAYLKAMEAQDAFAAGDKEKGLALYIETRREATKAYHALEKCPDYCPEARKALGKALSPIEKDPKVGPEIAKGKGKDRGH